MYVFFDIDGVLNQVRDCAEYDKNCVRVLATILKDTDSKAVLISTRRVGFTHDISRCAPDIKRLRLMMHEFGVDIYSRTGQNRLYRTQEIDDFIEAHGFEPYCVLDDDETLFTDMTHVYLVNYKTGLAQNDIRGIKALLKRW